MKFGVEVPTCTNPAPFATAQDSRPRGGRTITLSAGKSQERLSCPVCGPALARLEIAV